MFIVFCKVCFDPSFFFDLNIRQILEGKIMFILLIFSIDTNGKFERVPLTILAEAEAAAKVSLPFKFYYGNVVLWRR